MMENCFPPNIREMHLLHCTDPGTAMDELATKWLLWCSRMAKQRAYREFMTGFVVSDKEVWGRPVGIGVAKDGSLIVTEDGNGTIWRVTYKKQVSKMN